MNDATTTIRDDAPSLAALASFTRIEKLVTSLPAYQHNGDHIATAADLIADALVWAAAHDNTWADPDSAAETMTALTNTGMDCAQLEMSAYDPLRDDDHAAQQLHDLETITPETQYFGSAPAFARRAADAAAAVTKFEKQFTGAAVTFIVDESEGAQGVLVQVTIGDNDALFADNEYNGWTDVLGDMGEGVWEQIEALASDPAEADVIESLNEVHRDVAFVFFAWGYVGVDALNDALSARVA
jgi:hypothetical protein